MKTLQPKLAQTQRGVAAVEATIALPFLFLLFFAVGELGRLMYQYNQLNSVVRDACRYLASQAYTDSNGASDLTLKANTQNTAKALALYGKSSGTTPLLSGLEADDISIAISGGDLITVTATYNWAPIFSSNPDGYYGNPLDYSFPLTATISMRAIP